jgi:hypothetical protein
VLVCEGLCIIDVYACGRRRAGGACCEAATLHCPRMVWMTQLSWCSCSSSACKARAGLLMYGTPQGMYLTSLATTTLDSCTSGLHTKRSAGTPHPLPVKLEGGCVLELSFALWWRDSPCEHGPCQNHCCFWIMHGHCQNHCGFWIMHLSPTYMCKRIRPVRGPPLGPSSVSNKDMSAVSSHAPHLERCLAAHVYEYQARTCSRGYHTSTRI